VILRTETPYGFSENAKSAADVFVDDALHIARFGNQSYDLPILKILVPHSGQRPWVAGRPFFIVMSLASLISRLLLHLTQYPSLAGIYRSPPRRCAFAPTSWAEPAVAPLGRLTRPWKVLHFFSVLSCSLAPRNASPLPSPTASEPLQAGPKHPTQHPLQPRIRWETAG